MALEIKSNLIDKQDALESNNDHQPNGYNVCNSNLALNSVLRDNMSLSSSNQNLLNLKNSSTTNTNLLASTQKSLPQSQLSSLMKNSSGNKFNLNSSGASMSIITSSTKPTSTITKSLKTTTGTKMGSRRIFTPQFKLQVLESYRNDNDCKGNQRATARKYGIHRRQIQKWLQCENNLRSIIANNPENVRSNQMKLFPKGTAPILSSSTNSRQRGVVNTDKNGATYSCFSLANVKNFKASNDESLSTKNLSSVSSSFGEFTSRSTSNNTTTALEASKHVVLNNNFCYDNDSLVTNNYKNSIVDDYPIDLSCNHTKVKIENVARPIPIHPSSSHYKIPFYIYDTDFSSNKNSLHYQYQTFSSPQITDISNSLLKTDLVDPIDLSTTNISQKRKHVTDDNKKDKPLKLFRPYLESNFEKDIDKSKKLKQDDSEKFPMIWSNNYNFYPQHNISGSDYQPFLMTCSQPIFRADSQNVSKFPPATSSLSSPNDSGIMINSNYHILLSQASPVSGYDSSTSSMYSFNDNEVDLIQGNSPLYTSSHYETSSPSFSISTMSPIATETKVPLSPSLLHDLKFKLHTLDCYYNDADCERNEKLVAKKLNINCKIVEKWLRQEGDLRKQYHLQIIV
ncbi:unnamed protein product [Chironomus riparius]|uniref:Brinker DNA-binding domain-containing protein n=1 Tax=Chironomus riparius TaxID=315576 RepID=A0A9N9RUI9_9DIPT|nr:unnamed protein product [Chironomus riparius]